MKILETSFRKKGFFHEQVWREKDLAVYKRWRVTMDANPPHWEAIIIKDHGEYKLGNVIIEAGQSYPGASTWGILGWTLATEKAAFEKIKWIKKHRKELEEARKTIKVKEEDE